jgi:hypothetical protein
MDASPFHDETPRRPVLRFIRYFGIMSGYMLSCVFFCWGAMLAFIWLVIIAVK